MLNRRGIIGMVVATIVALMVLSSCTITFAQAQAATTESAMNKAFSCIVSKSGKVYWEVGTDSCDKLINKFKLQDNEKTSYAKVEILPDNSEESPYLYPERPWKLVIDEKVMPTWLTQEHKDAVWKAFEEWKKIVYQFDYSAARNPFNPTKVTKHEPTEEDILLLKKWISVYQSLGTTVRTSVRDSIKASIGDSMGTCVWDSVYAFGEKCKNISNVAPVVEQASGKKNVGSKQEDFIAALIGSYFPNIKKWRYYEGDTDGYPYQSAVELWNRGFVVSYDSQTWRLHSAKDGAIVFTVENQEVATNKAFSCVVLKSGEVYWETGIDSCNELINKFKLQDEEKTSYAKVEIVPDNNEKYSYLYPEKPWKLIIDEKVTPSWLTEHKDAVWKAFEEWKKIVYQFDYSAARKPFDPAKVTKHKPTEEDILLLKEWASIWKDVRDSGGSIGSSIKSSVWHSAGACVLEDIERSVEVAFRELHVNCPGAVVTEGIENFLGTSLDTSVKDTIGDSVGDSLEALIGSYFTNVKEWKYEGGTERYPYQSAAELWYRGFIPSFDGEIWRLSFGEEAAVVFEIPEEELFKKK